jgi:UDP-hydrolysing UDP-N-acetyl-D-glucosamine 2-epimerase
MGRAVAGIAEALERLEPDGLVLLGDRFEIFGAGAAATALGIPIAHLCGGESTSGALDDVWRDGLTVMASLHLVAAEPYAAAVRGLGADPSSVHVVGSPGLEAARLLERSSLAALGESVGLELERPLMLLAFHPATAPGPDEPSSGEQLDALEAALGERPGTLIATFANADAGGRAVNERLQAMARERPNTIAVPSLGSERYLQALALADVLVGNSSSGLIEAPAFELPVVNIGSRQGGRLRAANVIDAEPTRQAIGEALDRALDANFRADLAGLENPYGDGHTSGRVVALLEHELETWAR